MKRTITTLAALAALVAPATAAAGDTAPQLTQAPDVAAFGFTKRCKNVHAEGLVYRNIRARNMSCKQARNYVRGYDLKGRDYPIPSAYDCAYVVLRSGLEAGTTSAFRYFCGRHMTDASGLPVRALAWSVT